MHLIRILSLLSCFYCIHTYIYSYRGGRRRAWSCLSHFRGIHIWEKRIQAGRCQNVKINLGWISSYSVTGAANTYDNHVFGSVAVPGCLFAIVVVVVPQRPENCPG